MKIITAVMKSCIAVMKIMTARDEKIHYGGYNFMPSEKSIFQMQANKTTKQTNVWQNGCGNAMRDAAVSPCRRSADCRSGVGWKQTAGLGQMVGPWQYPVSLS